MVFLKLKRKNGFRQFGPNAITGTKNPHLAGFPAKMWAPVPWMLEASILLELILGKYIEAGVIGALVIFNALMSTLQENRAQNALALLRKRLTVTARVLRDGSWQMIPSAELVPGDVVYLRMGDLVPADLSLISGQVLLDQSTLTGESLPVDAEKDAISLRRNDGPARRSDRKSDSQPESTPDLAKPPNWFGWRKPPVNWKELFFRLPKIWSFWMQSWLLWS